jgi:hypothetical protein
MFISANREVNGMKELSDLKKLVEYGRKNPDKYDWRARLNQWEQPFALQMLVYERHIPNFVPTEKQLAKIVTIVEKMTIPVTDQ